MLDLKQIYSVLEYSYNQRDREPGESVCIVICPPLDIAQQFPMEGKAFKDASPPHVTVAYLGDIDLAMEDKVEKIARLVAESTKPFDVKIGAKGKFSNDEHDVYHSRIQSKKLHRFRDDLKSAYAMGQMNVDSKHPEYKPHMTLEYVKPGEKAQYKDLRPEGKWKAENAWLWGLSQPHLLQFK